MLWQLGFSGILNLNLDRLATRAYATTNTGRPLSEFSGPEAGQSVHLLKSPHPFVANLHGVSDNASTWVFGYDDLRYLLANPGYIQFIDACLATRTVLFIGVSADDVAAGGHLARLTRAEIDTGAHYWITDRNDIETERWAEQIGIRVIRYSNLDGTHSELQEFLAALLDYVPQEQEAFPVIPRASELAHTDLPEPKDLLREDAETIRQFLNVKAKELLNSTSPEKYDTYNTFCNVYNQAIYRAWYVTTRDPDNFLLGYRLLDELGRGAFGTVYRALDGLGNIAAIKVLHEEVRNQNAMFQGFRRGVKSMEILSSRKVDGVVPYREASEIPAFVVMDYVDGPTLQQAVSSHRIQQWPTIIKVAVELVRIIHTSHKLPERVLHRDIRPSNVMLRLGWQDEEDWELVVLDFDLSWHRDAPEVSLVAPGTLNPYLAPEQIKPQKGESTRNAAVDSYGLGMTLLFLATGEQPEVMQHRRRDWDEFLARAAASHRCTEWVSLPNRFFRLVDWATRHKQSARWDMSQILRELERLRDALTHPTNVESAELLAEELASRSLDQPYKWSSDELAAHIDLPTGLSLAIKADEHRHEVKAKIEWKDMDRSAHHSKLTKWLPRASEQATSILRKANWHVSGGTTVGAAVGVLATIATHRLRADMAASVDAIRAVMRILTFNG